MKQLYGPYQRIKEVKKAEEKRAYSQKNDGINKRWHKAYKQKSAAAEINGLDNGTETPLVVSNGKYDQLLHTPYDFNSRPPFVLLFQHLVCSSGINIEN